MIKQVKDKIYLHQSDVIKKIERHFREELENIQDYKTPATTRQGTVRVDENDICLTDREQFKYRSAVGMMLFLVKYSRPDISNSVRELSKANNKANYAYYTQMLRVVKYVINTRNRMLKLIPENKGEKWEFKCMCNSDYAGDKDNRLSVIGYCIYVSGCLVSWKSRAQRSQTLSSTEAEYVALSEICNEILFRRMIMEFLGEKVKYPITVFSNNVGAIYLAYNKKISRRTKHVYTRTHFVQN